MSRIVRVRTIESTVFFDSGSPAPKPQPVTSLKQTASRRCGNGNPPIALYLSFPFYKHWLNYTAASHCRSDTRRFDHCACCPKHCKAQQMRYLQEELLDQGALPMKEAPSSYKPKQRLTRSAAPPGRQRAKTTSFCRLHFTHHHSLGSERREAPIASNFPC